MSRPRDGNRSKRINYCMACRQAIVQGNHAQMLRFNYLCQDCQERGYQLKMQPSAQTGKSSVQLLITKPEPAD